MVNGKVVLFLFSLLFSSLLFIGSVLAPNIPDPVFCSFEGLSTGLSSCSGGYEARVVGSGRADVGYAGRAVILEDNGYIFLSQAEGSQAEGLLSAQEGSIEFWFKPAQNGGSQNVLLASAFTGNDFFSLRYTPGEGIRLSIRGEEQRRAVDGSSWIETRAIENILLNPEQWYHLAYSWKRNADRNKPDEYHVFVDGRELSFKTEFRTATSSVNDVESNGFSLPTRTKGNLATLPTRFNVDPGGSSALFLGYRKASREGVYDELKIYNYMKTQFCPECERIALDDRLVVYQKPLFGEEGEFNLVYPSSKPKDSEIIDEIRVRATPGEFEPASFILFSAREYRGISARVTSLESAGLRIPSRVPAENLKLQVVKVWPQAGYGGGPTAAGEFGGVSNLRQCSYLTDRKSFILQ